MGRSYLAGSERFMYRPAVMGKNGMVSSAEPLATMAGVSILQEGGNAFDAAIAVNSVLNVTEPHMCGIGGDIFFLLYDAKEKEIVFLNGSGRSGRQATIDYFQDQGLESIPLQGFQSMVTVPGCVDGWCSLNEKYGSMPLYDLLRFAVEYAYLGHPVSHQLSGWIKKNARLLAQFPTTARVYLKNGRPYMAGEIIFQQDLARTLSIISEEGREAFYEGEIAERMVRFLQENGGILDRQDFCRHRSDWGKPISTEYRGYTIYETPPNTQGISALQGFNILEGFDLQSMGHNSAESLHLMCEAKKLAFADRDRYITDPEFAEIPVEYLLDKQYAASQRQLIDRGITLLELPALTNPMGDTTYFAVADVKGNIVSSIQSIYYPFGSGVTVADTGILFHNRGACFSLDPRHINRLEPEKRTMHSLIAAMVFRENQPFLAFGTMGGDGQPQNHLSVISNIIDHGMNIQQAIEAPRWIHGDVGIGGRKPRFNIEGRVSKETIRGLRARGYDVNVMEDWTWNVGHAQGVLIDPETGIYQGGADPRGGGFAAGW